MERSGRKQLSSDAAGFEAISPALLDRMTAPLRLYFSPRFFGLEHLDPERPALLVGNHTLYGVFDWPLFIAELYRERGVLVRSLADRAHFRAPIWRDQIRRFGIVEGSPENCSALMSAGAHVLVFPGGAREVCKRRGEQYLLTWKSRTGFARLAIQHGYPILPFASVGPDNAFDILVDADDIARSPLGGLMRATGVARFLRDFEFLPPLCRGIGPTLLPRPQPFYFMLGEAIDTSAWRGQHRRKRAQWELRERTEAEVNQLIGRLLQLREQDHGAGRIRRLLMRL